MRPRTTLLAGNFFFSIFVNLTLYTLLPFLSSYISETTAGLLIAVGSCFGLLGFFFLPALAERYGAQRLALIFAITESLLLLALAFNPGVIASVFLIIFSISLQPFIYYQFDLLLEAQTKTAGVTGRMRTLFLTAGSIGFLIAPLFLGLLLGDSDAYGRAFLAASAALLPLIVFFATRHLPEGKPPSYMEIRRTLSCIMGDRDLAAVTVGHLLLYLFFMWAPLYIPVYLHNVLGLPWSTLGWMFTVMLIPYVLIQYPSGIIADRWLGDKEMLFAGFLLAGSALAAVGVLTSATPIAIILIVLISTRVGAALIESMTEAHFFRRVSEKDVNSVGVFRGIWPLADIIAPVAGSIILFFANYEILFLATGGFIALAGMGATLFIKDFR